MSTYRRAYQSGGHYFFTVVTFERQRYLVEPDNIDRLRAAFRHVQRRHPFTIDAIVILPDHLHTIWRLPPGDSGFSLRWRLIKHYVARGIDVPVNRRGEKPIWQRRFWEHLLRDEEDWRNHMDYIHYNPVRHGHANSPGQWPYSSFHHAVRRGWYDPDWGTHEPKNLHGMNCE